MNHLLMNNLIIRSRDKIKFGFKINSILFNKNNLQHPQVRHKSCISNLEGVMRNNYGQVWNLMTRDFSSNQRCSNPVDKKYFLHCKSDIRLGQVRCKSGKSKIEKVEEDVIRRTKVITSVEETKAVVSDIVRLGKPIGVDMEGVTESTLGLLQILTSEGNIYLFRTGINPDILRKTGMKEMFEDQNIIKVMHASTVDMMCIYKEGIKFWGLFDTCIAHLIIRYQTMGESILSPQISFNDCCETYGVRANPLKDIISGSLWKRQETLYHGKNLEDDFIFYSAYDVLPLLDLYEILKSLIEPDFVHLYEDLVEMELLRCIDSELHTMKQKGKSKMSSNDLFLYNLPSEVRKAHLYDAVSSLEGYKKVYFCESYRTAHVILANRPAAVLAYKSLSTKIPEKFGKSTRVALVKDLKPLEIAESQREYTKHLDRLKEDNYIVDHAMSADLVDKLIQAKSPIVCDFHLLENLTCLEVFAGRYPPLKFNMTPDSVVKGKLGVLLSNANDVTKIVGRIDSGNVYAGLRFLSNADFRAANFFELSTATKLFDYWFHGQSIYKTTSPNQKEVLRRFGLVSPNRLENMLYLYLHLTHELPVEFLEFLSAKSQVDLDIGGQISISEAKEVRKQLRLKMEAQSFHVTCQRGNPSNLKTVLARFLMDHEISYKRIIAAGKHAIVELEFQGDSFAAIRKLQLKNLEGMVLTASQIELKPVGKLSSGSAVPLVNVEKMEKMNLSTVEDLENLGFFSTAGKPQEVPTHSNRTFSSLSHDDFKTLFQQ